MSLSNLYIIRSAYMVSRTGEPTHPVTKSSRWENNYLPPTGYSNMILFLLCPKEKLVGSGTSTVLKRLEVPVNTLSNGPTYIGMLGT